jgi:para-aminobenzoate synthetase component 1
MNGYRCRELPLPADALALFARLRSLPGSFLLYSGNGFPDQRFDVFSAWPDERVRLDSGNASSRLDGCVADMIARLAASRCAAADFPLPGWFGLASYDVKNEPRVGASAALPELEAGFYPAIFLVDRERQAVSCVWLDGFETVAERLMAYLEPSASLTGEFRLLERFAANMTPAEYAEHFQRVQEYLHAGDCYQVNLAQRFAAHCQGDPWPAYAQLARALPAPMGGYFNCGDFQVLSLSPERFLSVREGRITTHPIKGTRPRHPDPHIDRQSAEALRTSEKDRAENLMIVDLLRNDLGLSCVPGSIRVTDLFAIESFANVHHLVSHIEGTLRPNIHPLQAFLAAFPGGSITGAPKKRAMEIITELEPHSRRFYCGSAFYCDVSGRLDSSILIRSLLCEGGELYCWGGGGVVVDSTAEAEYQETLDKVGVILRTLERMSGVEES